MQNKSASEVPTSRDATGITWIVVADAAQAYIYSRQTRRGPLEMLQHLTEENARAAEHDLATDAPGRTFDSLGAARHSKQPEHTVKQNLRTAFARRIAEYVQHGRTKNHYAQLAIIAAPALLGELRAQLDDATQRLLDVEIPKHMTNSTAAEIARELLAAG